MEDIQACFLRELVAAIEKSGPLSDVDATRIVLALKHMFPEAFAVVP
jgi:hypothetical protein